MSNQEQDPTRGKTRVRLPWRWIVRGIVLLVVAAAGLYLFFQYRETFTLANLARQEELFRRNLETRPVVTYGAAFLLYVAVTALSLPFGAVMTVVYGWLFGLWAGLLLVSFASTAGATGAFLLSRYLFGTVIQRRYGDRLGTFNRALEREGAYYLFTLRLVPIFPFFVINAVMGLTTIRTRTFWWVSQLGMLPGTFVYLFAGASITSLGELRERGLPSLLTPQLFIAFALLGIFPLAVKKLVGAIRKRPVEAAGKGPAEPPSDSESAEPDAGES